MNLHRIGSSPMSTRRRHDRDADGIHDEADKQRTERELDGQLGGHLSDHEGSNEKPKCGHEEREEEQSRNDPQQPPAHQPERRAEDRPDCCGAENAAYTRVREADESQRLGAPE
jgi:hypothetical protein